MLWLAGLPITLLLLALGLRGRRIDDHPVCRKCKFDLFGLTNPTACPECGHILANSKSIQHGQRRPRRALIALGALLSITLLSAAGASRWAAIAGFNWNTVKPAWWLASEVHDDPTTQKPAAALEELVSRLAHDQLSPRQAADIVNIGLLRQADPATTWARQWSDFIELAWDKNLLTDEQKSRYARAYPLLSVVGPSPVRENSPWELWLHIGRARLGSIRFQMHIQLISIDVEDQPQSGYASGDSLVELHELNNAGLSYAGIIMSAPGKRTVHTRWRLGVQEVSAGLDGPILASWEEELSLPVEVLGPVSQR